ncbi:caspase family protein [Yinghuangia soli]|uniref:Caspase family protein n=1 Tax=Yinghuangia soli TaxID=2908204 RepID=A0AA41TYI4_9ACTN|nr:caspase family protein [Yinghuangia soli]MCF2526215.1 caspase family protein [Yinghuangia soli]
MIGDGRRGARGARPQAARRALLVTGSRFRDEDRYPRLTSAVEDGRHLEALLRRDASHILGGFEVERLHNAKAASIEERIEAHLEDAEPGDTRFLYLSTHADRAEPERGDKGPPKVYFVAEDTTRARLAKSGLAAGWVADAIAACQASTVIVVVDTCYAGAIAEELAFKRNLTEELRGPSVEERRKRQDPRSSILLRAQDHVPGAGLHHVGLVPTVVILASCRATERAAAGGGWKPSEFTRAFIDTVRSGAGVGPEVYAALFRTVLPQVDAQVRSNTRVAGQRSELVVVSPEDPDAEPGAGPGSGFGGGA